MRVALYARYSDDRQNERSIADQVVVCRRHAEARGWTVVATFSDAAISGSAMANRPGLHQLLAQAEAGEFDLVLVEEQDRLARNLEHEAHVFNRLKQVGVGIATLQTDRVQIMDVAFKGLMSELFLEGLSAKTKRGMHSNAEKGLATGSKLYGYVTAPGGAQSIVEEQAQVIRRIFDDYGGGYTGREIADRLNRDHIPGPQGGVWNASTIVGSRHRGNGILRSEIYVGVKVWNRFDMRKDRATGKKVQRIRPEAEWRRVSVPHLTIVDQAAWDAVQKRFAISGPTRTPHLANRHKPGLFSGLLKCGDCGGNYTIKANGRLMCSNHVNKGDAACANRRSVMRAEVEDRVLTGLRTRMLSPAAVAAYVRAYHAEWHATAAARRNRRAPLDRRLGELTRTIERLIDAICEGAASPAMRARLAMLETEKAEIETQLQDTGDDSPIALHPGAADVYAQQVRELHERLAELTDGRPTADDRKVIEAVRRLVEKVEIRPTSQDKRSPVELLMFGRVAEFMRPSGDQVAPSGSRLVVGGVCTSEPTFSPASIRIAV